MRTRFKGRGGLPGRETIYVIQAIGVGVGDGYQLKRPRSSVGANINVEDTAGDSTPRHVFQVAEIQFVLIENGDPQSAKPDGFGVDRIAGCPELLHVVSRTAVAKRLTIEKVDVIAVSIQTFYNNLRTGRPFTGLRIGEGDGVRIPIKCRVREKV